MATAGLQPGGMRMDVYSEAALAAAR
jgi:hypothetical protein